MTEKLKAWINGLLRKRGYQITKTSTLIDPLGLSTVLQRVARHVPKVGTVIDVGASNGSWTDVVRPTYPDAAYYLIDANPHHQPALERFCARHPRTQFILAAAGDQVGEISFDMTDPFGGVAAYTPLENSVKVPMTTVDIEVERHQLPGPYFLQLDTHGFEIPILKGAENTLKHTDLVEIEVYNFHQIPGSLLFHEMVAFMAERGFRPIDLCDPLWRELDGAWWQMDIFFARADHPMFAKGTYR